MLTPMFVRVVKKVGAVEEYSINVQSRQECIDHSFEVMRDPNVRMCRVADAWNVNQVIVTNQQVCKL